MALTSDQNGLLLANAAFMSNVVYGGSRIPSDYRSSVPYVGDLRDDYRTYLQTQSLEVLDYAKLSTYVSESAESLFQNGGLYSNGTSQGLLAVGDIGGQKTLSLTFRGSDSELASLAYQEAFSATGLFGNAGQRHAEG